MSMNELGDTQPKKVKKARRPFPWLNILLFILVIAAGVFGSYQAAIGDRQNAQATLVSQQLKEQYDLALQDMEAGLYESAIQRFEFILQQNSGYPGVAEKLTEVLLKASITPTPTPTPIPPTPDLSGAEALFNRARELMSAQDWPNVLLTLDSLRKEDPTYHTVEVDGMYYVALRSYGVDKISKQGDLEGGIYQLTLAERFAPLDGYAEGLRNGARMYLTGASFWEVDWKQAVNYFSQVAPGWPSLWDSSSNMTAAERYRIALSSYGDFLYKGGEDCEAYEQYQLALTYGALSEESAKNAKRAYNVCYPPTEEVPTEEVITDDGVVETATP